MTEHPRTEMTLPADLNQVDDTGYVWTFLSAAANPGSITPGALLVAGDDVGPFLARVVDMIDGPGGDSIVHLDVVGVPTI
ncbi:MAG: hypothetical protein ACKVWR_01250 [Acidimicrobiales bacterium]